MLPAGFSAPGNLRPGPQNLRSGSLSRERHSPNRNRHQGPFREPVPKDLFHLQMACLNFLSFHNPCRPAPGSHYTGGTRIRCRFVMGAPFLFALRPSHTRTALRTRHPVARSPGGVRQPLATFRADASSARSGGRQSAHPSASAAGGSAAQASAATHAHSDASWQHVSPCLPQALPPGATAGHRKPRSRDISAQSRRDDVIYRPAHESDHPYARRSQQGLQQRRDRTTDENIRLQPQKLFSPSQ